MTRLIKLDRHENKMIHIQTKAFRIKVHWSILPYPHWETIIEDRKEGLYIMACGGHRENIRLSIKEAIKNLRDQKNYMNNFLK